MSGSTSSAQPQELIDYWRVLAPMDRAVVTASAALAGDLAAFESSCTEYLVHVKHLADTMAAHGRRAGRTDLWVKKVGDEFLWADSGPVEAVAMPGTPLADRVFDFSGLFALGADVAGVGSAAILWQLLRTTRRGRHYLMPGKVVNALRWLAMMEGGRTVYRAAEFTRGMGAAAWVVSGLLVAQQWQLDMRDFEEGKRDKSQLASAMIVDAGTGFAPVIATAAAVALLSNPVGWAAIGIGAGGIALGIGQDHWLSKDGGINRERLIEWVDRRVVSNPRTYVSAAGALAGPVGLAAATGVNYFVGEGGAEHRQQVKETAERGAAWVDDNILQPVGDAITSAPERARTWVDDGIKGLINSFGPRRIFP